MNEFEKIPLVIDDALKNLESQLNKSQTRILRELRNELRSFDTNAGNRLTANVGNIRRLGKIRSMLENVIMSKEYKGAVTEFMKSFDVITNLQNQYFLSLEANFKPPLIAKEIRKQSITETVHQMGRAGVVSLIADDLTKILKQHISTGATYGQMLDSVEKALTNTEASEGMLTRYSKTITTDAIHQYNANYTQAITSDLGYEWFIYQNSLIETSRCFCVGMVNKKYFHKSEVPNILKGIGIYCEDKDGNVIQVPIHKKTGLPNGMKEETNESNFMILRGGWGCRHIIRPMATRNVPDDIKKNLSKLDTEKKELEKRKPPKEKGKQNSKKKKKKSVTLAAKK